MINRKIKQIQNSILYFIPPIVSAFIPFVTLPIFTRILTKEDYGILALAQVFAVVLTGIANFGLPIVYERNFFEIDDPKTAGQLFYSTLAFVIVIFSLLAIITYFFRFYIAKFIIGTTAYSSLIILTFCSTFLISIKIYFLTYFKNTENAKLFVTFAVSETVLAAILALVFVVKYKLGVTGMVMGPLFSSCIITCLLFYVMLKILPFGLNWHLLKSSIKLSYPLTPRILFNVFGNQLDKYLIGLLNTTGGVGIYSIGQRISNIVFIGMTALQNTYSPNVYKMMFGNRSNGGQAIGKYLTPFAYISIFIALVISLFAQEFVVLLTPDSFHGSIDIIMIFSMLYGSYFFGKQPQLIFSKKTFITSLLTLLHIGLNIGLNIPFILKWGAIGAAWATLLAGLISAMISFIVSQHYYHIDWEYKHLIYIFLIFYVFTISILLLRHYNASYQFLLGIKFVAMCIYIHAGIQCNVINTDNLSIVKKIITKSP